MADAGSGVAAVVHASRCDAVLDTTTTDVAVVDPESGA